MVRTPPLICLLIRARAAWYMSNAEHLTRSGYQRTVWVLKQWVCGSRATARVCLIGGGWEEERENERPFLSAGTTERARRLGSYCRQWHSTLMTERQWEEQKLRCVWAVWYKHTTHGTESPFLLEHWRRAVDLFSSAGCVKNVILVFRGIVENSSQHIEVTEWKQKEKQPEILHLSSIEWSNVVL